MFLYQFLAYQYTVCNITYQQGRAEDTILENTSVKCPTTDRIYYINLLLEKSAI